MADVKWIKLTTNIFEDEKIRMIENMPEGDAILIIWLKLLTLAGKKNDCGAIYFTPSIPYTPETLGDLFRKDSRIISLALMTFEAFDMIYIEADIIKVLNWEKHQNVDGLEKIREQNRKRVAKHRNRKKLKDSNATSNVTVTECNATEEERDVDIEPIKGSISTTEKEEISSEKPHWFCCRNCGKNVRSAKEKCFDCGGYDWELQCGDNIPRGIA